MQFLDSFDDFFGFSGSFAGLRSPLPKNSSTGDNFLFNIS